MENEKKICWETLRQDKGERMAQAEAYVQEGKTVPAKNTVKLLEAVIRPGDRVNLEGNNQKQADFLAEKLCRVNKEKVHGLHMVQSSMTLDSHLKLFEKGIAEKADFLIPAPRQGQSPR